MKTQGLSSVQAAPPAVQPDRISTVAREFEALFTSMMFKAMRRTVGEDPLMPAGLGEKIYTGMLDDEYAKLIGMHQSLGLAGLVEKELRGNESADIQGDLKATPSWMLDEWILSAGGSQVKSTSRDFEGLSERVERWGSLIDQAAEIHGVDRHLVAAVIAQESGGNRFAVSRAGAKGLMQLMDTTARSLGVASPFDPRQNVMGGVRYLRELLDRHGGDERLALACYNAGPSAVEKYGDVPPYRETRDYVRSVLAIRSRLASAHALETAEKE